MARGTSLKDHIGTVGKRIEMILSRMIYHNTEVLLLYLVSINTRESRLLAVVMETSTKTHGLAGSLRKVVPI